MKVVHVITDLHGGGAEKSLVKLLRWRRSRELHCVDLCAEGSPEGCTDLVVSLLPGGVCADELAALAVPVVVVDPRRWFGLPGLWAALRAVRGHQPQVVLGWMYHGNLLAAGLRLLAQPRARLVFGIRQCLYRLADEKPTTRLVIRGNALLSRWADGIIYNAALSRRQHEAFGFAQGPGQVVHNGIDCQEFQPSPAARTSLRGQWAVAEDQLLVGNVSRWHPVKGHGDLLAAVAAAKRQLPQLRLVLAGRGLSPDNPDLVAQLATWGLSDSILLGEVAQVAHLLPALDLFVLASRAEAFPNVVAEAMSCAVPVVATRVGDVPELLAATGSLVMPGDIGALAEAIAAALLQERAKPAAGNSSGRARILQHFSLDSAGSAFLAALAPAANPISSDHRQG